MRDYDKLKNIYSEFTNENYQYTNELNENIRSQVLEALRLNPSQAIARLAKILETEKQGNKLLYSAAFYKRLIVDFDLKFGDPYEIRTRVTAVKGRCPNR